MTGLTLAKRPLRTTSTSTRCAKRGSTSGNRHKLYRRQKLPTKRPVWPLDVQDFSPTGAMLTCCEKRQKFRNFRFDRITELALIQEKLEAPRSVRVALYSVVISDHK